MRAARCLLLVLALGASAAARADEVTDQLDQASRYYQDGDITGAIGELEFVLQALRGRIGQELLATFPAPPDGWTAETADEAGAIPFVAAGTMLSRTYKSADGASSIEAQLMSGGGFLQGLAGMMMNPTMLAAQPNAKRVRVGREAGVVTYDADAEIGPAGARPRRQGHGHARGQGRRQRRSTGRARPALGSEEGQGAARRLSGLSRTADRPTRRSAAAPSAPSAAWRLPRCCACRRGRSGAPCGPRDSPWR